MTGRGKADEACDENRNRLCVALSKAYEEADRKAKNAKEMDFQKANLEREAVPLKQAGCPGSFTVPKY